MSVWRLPVRCEIYLPAPARRLANSKPSLLHSCGEACIQLVSRPGRCAKSNPMGSEPGAGDSKFGTPIRARLALQDATTVRRPNSTQLDAMPTVRCGALQSGNSRHKRVQKTSIKRAQRSNRHCKPTASCGPPKQRYVSTKNRVAVLGHFGRIATPETTKPLHAPI